MSANLRLIDANGNSYNFPPDFFLAADGWKVSSDVKNIAFAAGGRDTADGFLEARTITIEGAVRASTAAAFETAQRAIKKAVLRGGDLYVSDDVVSRFITVKSPMVDSRYLGDYRLEHPMTINFVVEYPFWEAAAQSAVLSGTGGIVDQEEFTVDNSASDHLTLPVITITADQGYDLPSVKLVNLTDGGMVFEYNDPNFKQGDTLEIDSKAGTVKRNGNDAMAYVVQARFPRLQPQVNTLRYEGATCSLDIVWREVTL